MAPPMAHASRIMPDVPTRCATMAGFRKMPAPMMAPTTTMVASKVPRRRSYPAPCAESVGGLVSGMIAEHRTLECRTRGNDDIVDLTDQLQIAIAETGVQTGQAALMVQGSTASLTTLEYEPGLVNHDITAALEGIAPRDARYVHEETWHDDNGHSHVRASVVGPSMALPIVEGRVPLGTWQQVVLIDSDTRPRSRVVHLSVVGV